MRCSYAQRSNEPRNERGNRLRFARTCVLFFAACAYKKAPPFTFPDKKAVFSNGSDPVHGRNDICNTECCLLFSADRGGKLDPFCVSGDRCGGGDAAFSDIHQEGSPSIFSAFYGGNLFADESDANGCSVRCADRAVICGVLDELHCLV